MMPRTPLRILKGSLSFITLTVGLAACKSTGPIRSQVNIAQGEFVASQDPIARSTVSIMDRRPEIGEFCTGTVISANHILTAAHCFNDTTRVPSILFSNYFLPDQPRPVEIREVEWVALHSGYSEAVSAEYDTLIEKAKTLAEIPVASRKYYDLAVVKFKGTLPDRYQPVSLISRPELKGNTTILTAGYGCTNSQCQGLRNVLYKVPMKLLRLDEAPGLVILGAVTAGQGSCPGDSGGPDFQVKPEAGAALQQFAVISTGPSECEGGLTVDTLLIPEYLGWIEAAVKKGQALQGQSAYRFLSFVGKK